MSAAFVPRVGAVFSADIAVPEHEREARFYARVLGTGERPLWREDLMNSQGMPIIGLAPRTEPYAQLPLQWMPHIQVADVGASAERALQLGGRVLMQDTGAHPWAVLLDPHGAAFGIIPVVPAEAMPRPEQDGAAEGTSPSGRIAWLDLTVPDADARRDFYREVVGWSAQDLEMKDGDARYADYVMLGGDGEPAAGVCHARGVNADLPPVWMIYLPVGDLDESLRRVEQEGGSVLRAVRGGNGQHVYAAIRDPAGVCLALTPA